MLSYKSFDNAMKSGFSLFFSLSTQAGNATVAPCIYYSKASGGNMKPYTLIYSLCERL